MTTTSISPSGPLLRLSSDLFLPPGQDNTDQDTLGWWFLQAESESKPHFSAEHTGTGHFNPHKQSTEESRELGFTPYYYSPNSCSAQVWVLSSHGKTKRKHQHPDAQTGKERIISFTCGLLRDTGWLISRWKEVLKSKEENQTQTN